MKFENFLKFLNFRVTKRVEIDRSRKETLVTSTISSRTEQWIGQARAGDPLALGPLLESYAQQLRRIADRQLDDKLRGRISSSDIVQETLLQATRDFPRFSWRQRG